VNLATRHAHANVAALKPVQMKEADERGVDWQCTRHGGQGLAIDGSCRW
jgi:hypothetical protein